MTATVGGGLSFESQAAGTESIDRWELKVEHENRSRRVRKMTGCFKRRFLAEDKEVPLVQNRYMNEAS
jgi:hypothetical protein